MLASKTRKKREKTSFGHDNFFFSKSLLLNIHTTDHIYKIAVRKNVFENILFLENSPVQPLTLICSAHVLSHLGHRVLYTSFSVILFHQLNHFTFATVIVAVVDIVVAGYDDTVRDRHWPGVH